MIPAICVLVTQLLESSSTTARLRSSQTSQTSMGGRSAAVEAALPNDNRVAAGHLVNGVLTLALDAREVMWHPDGTGGGAIPLYAFAETGHPATIPGPLIRVPAGTDLAVSVRNTLPKPIRFRGLPSYTQVSASYLYLCIETRCREAAESSPSPLSRRWCARAAPRPKARRRAAATMLPSA